MCSEMMNLLEKVSHLLHKDLLKIHHMDHHKVHHRVLLKDLSLDNIQLDLMHSHKAHHQLKVDKLDLQPLDLMNK